MNASGRRTGSAGPGRAAPPLRALVVCVLVAAGILPSWAQDESSETLDSAFRNPPAEAHPWVYWYWMDAAVSRKGIAADLEAMKAAGLEGAYLMPIKGPDHPPLVVPPIVQLTPAWWDCVRFAFRKADELGLKLALHDCDGFATAGGPWITPELSMQKVVWTEAEADGGRHLDVTLPKPAANDGYYRDIAVFALAGLGGAGVTSRTAAPVVTTSLGGVAPQFLATPAAEASGAGPAFGTRTPCWIQYAFARPFTCRAITIQLPPAPNAYQPNTYQANRLIVEAGDDGIDFRRVTRLTPPRHGWQDGDADVTHAIPAVTARWFRFVYDPSGAEPGAEDLDSAKWKPGLKLRGIELWSEPRIDGFEGKSGAVWRISAPTTTAEVPSADCVPLRRIIDVSRHMDASGRLSWDAPAGHWTILRMGHTSTGHFNETGGGGKGLECDKFNPAAVRIQFDHWFGEAVRRLGPELAHRVLTIFHVDSWECGSQNWSPVFREEFRRRRGYDPLPYLPVMAGIPVGSADLSERFLRDVRTTIGELVADNFFGTLARLAHAQGCEFSAESVAPTMEGDGMAHFAKVDIPMGEFWLRSPANDKLNDILDAVSGARVYGHVIVQSESFTERMLRWDEAPVMLKPLQDRNYCFGINRFVYHVFTENPWLDRRPGMTLSGVGLFFQRDQTWWQPGRAWIRYAARCQALLQRGHAVADLAVFTGEEMPRRAYVPWALAGTFPRIIPPVPVVMAGRESPRILEPGDWVDPLHGYAYDSINRDALLRLARVRAGRLVLPGGSSYRVLVLPCANAMDPIADALTPEAAAKVGRFAGQGGVVVLGERPDRAPSLSGYPGRDGELAATVERLWPEGLPADGSSHAFGPGCIVTGPFRGADFRSLGIPPDVAVTAIGAVGGGVRPHRLGGAGGGRSPGAGGFAWTHRAGDGWDLYFLSNQRREARGLLVTFRIAGRRPEIWDPVTGGQALATSWRVTNDGRTEVPIRFPRNGSIFVVFRKADGAPPGIHGVNGADPRVVETVGGGWSVAFDQRLGGPAGPIEVSRLRSWTESPDQGVRHYSGTATYRTRFRWNGDGPAARRVWLDLGDVRVIARVTVNGRRCGVAWTYPYRVEVTKALRPGPNELRVDVTNTWFNRLAGDRELTPRKRLTWTTAPDRTAGKPLLLSGLLGPVTLMEESE